MLSVQGLCLSRNGHDLISSLSFSLPEGQMLWLQGPNGIGKSSVLASLSGGLPAEKGQVSYPGVEILPIAMFASHTAWLGDQNPIKPGWTVWQNLTYLSRFYCSQTVDPSALKGQLQAQNLWAERHQSAVCLSFGQKKRLMLAAFLLNRQPVWLLDEPAVGLDQTARHALASHMLEALDAGKQIIVTSHEPFWQNLSLLNPRCMTLDLCAFSSPETGASEAF
ncbi:MAG: heme ABC exporter ATP-binding protein CcmA [Hydrogenovibrio sp.]|uniref:heme ABC exporter ATP-binding protein CcmA n=1 Tax=Hydrogenovibrio sp. TaxID=2065821 RepID=UPI0028703B12|nr:heme ABC exporter ATP-binding protein CcmA [Hydrogenovibrio sp.]MDR9499980.1 heme ABC exporter ATP-binding protein CcmA [Hydrogenovibrio sp.]